MSRLLEPPQATLQLTLLWRKEPFSLPGCQPGLSDNERIDTASLYGDVMLEAASQLQQQERIDTLVVRKAGLTARQAERFFAPEESELQA